MTDFSPDSGTCGEETAGVGSSTEVDTHKNGQIREGADSNDDMITSDDTYEGYAKKLKSVRKLVSKLHLKPSSKPKLPPPTHLTSNDKSMEDKADLKQPALSTSLLADYRYDMTYRQRGRAVLINNENFKECSDMPNRPNPAIDVDPLSSTLKDLGFLVQTFEDLTCGRIRHLMHLLSRDDHSDADCLLVAVMTHGDEGEIYGTDGPMNASEITTPFRGDHCQGLIGKPKLFIFQACRGGLVDQGVAINIDDVDETDALIAYEKAHTIPVEADFLLAYSSPDGYASWRNGTAGAWFIQSLVKVLNAYGEIWEITRMLALVNRMVALQYESRSQNTSMTQKKQMPCFVSTLTKELYFKPKEVAKEMHKKL
ncbi:caspase-3-like isoform X1 [Asterias amurensis]|uniref:caspase-3-like isoform X1 n=2 Tax=Asterias amurensis TaxID=7602 RepID=UPI003AB2AA65